MPFFKFRKAADEPASAPPAPQSIDALRQRAKHRLVGASVLVLLGVIGFPLLFDKQPRPIAVDMPIDIPDRNKVVPLAFPNATPSQSTPESTAPAAPVAAPAEVSPNAVGNPAKSRVLADEPGVITEAPEKNKPQAPVEKAVEAIKSEAKEVPKPASPAAPVVAAKPLEAVKAQSLLDGKTVDSPAAAVGRFVVQVGAFADATRAHEVRLKLERAGLKTYTNVAETKDGKRIRVRVGPFAARAEAEKASEKIKKLNLPAALLTL
ncbi:MAG: SPOR domain-containing protein [Rhodoferax sp.]|uniref:SPOR domain-containing protein n=1 Tax=Rhodoferax sp. TaxID=50421 RepID=UPI002609B858|nr:SPOR domain-containing protein [Rhodoferax sp.]MDD2881705.1 SPOR domain-containing protein [Rhodoferax sp.]